MKQVMGWLLLGVLLLVAVAVTISLTDVPQVTGVSPEIVVEEPATGVATLVPVDELPDKIVLDISFHTIEGLRILFDRAEKLR